MVIECRGLDRPQAVYYALHAPPNVRIFFDERFRLRMNADDELPSPERIKANFEAVLVQMGIPGEVDLEVLREAPDSGSGIRGLCTEQREERGQTET